MIERDLSKTTIDSFLTSINSLHRTNLTDTISEISVPIMGMYGHRDLIVSPGQWKPLSEKIPHARIERFKKAGHFIMLDQPEKFKNILGSFLESDV